MFRLFMEKFRVGLKIGLLLFVGFCVTACGKENKPLPDDAWQQLQAQMTQLHNENQEEIKRMYESNQKILRLFQEKNQAELDAFQQKIQALEKEVNKQLQNFSSQVSEEMKKQGLGIQKQIDAMHKELQQFIKKFKRAH